jgi:hypothetical protein
VSFRPNLKILYEPNPSSPPQGLHSMSTISKAPNVLKMRDKRKFEGREGEQAL